jgi:hypothetical protein
MSAGCIGMARGGLSPSIGAQGLVRTLLREPAHAELRIRAQVVASPTTRNAREGFEIGRSGAVLVRTESLGQTREVQGPLPRRASPPMDTQLRRREGFDLRRAASQTNAANVRRTCRLNLRSLLRNREGAFRKTDGGGE